MLKGTLLGEMTELLHYWWQLSQLPERPVTEIRHHYGPQQRQYILEVCTDAAPTTDLEVIYIHGGGWQFGSPENFRQQGRYFAHKLGKCWMLSVRRIPYYSIDHILEDLRSALKWILQQASPRTSYVLAGMSSGGHLCAHLALNPICHPDDQWPRRIAGLLLLAAPLNLYQMPYTPVVHLLAGRRDQMSFERADAIRLLRDAVDFPMLIVHGSRDAIVPVRVARSFYERALALCCPRVAWLEVAGGSHIDIASWILDRHSIQAHIHNWLLTIMCPD